MNRSVLLLVIALLASGACRKPADSIPTAIAAAQAPAAQTPATPNPTPQTPGSPPPATPAAQTPPGAQPTTAEKPKPMPAELPEVLARVNGQDVKKADFDAVIRNAELGMGRPFPPDRRDEVYRAALEQLITYTLLLQEAKARNVTVSDQEVEQRLADMRKTFPTEEAFKKALSDRAMSIERLRTDTQANLQIDKMVQGELADLPPATDEEAQAFYDKNPERFKQGESVRASHILIKVDAKADEAAKAKARAEIDSVLKQVKAGDDFAKLAQAHSQDEGSAPQGGDLNYFPRGKMVPQFDQVAFALKSGEVSDVVTTQFGYHIIKVTDHKAATTVPLDQVKDKVKQFLQAQKKQQRTETFIATLRQKSKIEVLV